MSDTTTEIRELGRRWVDAELRGDADALAALSVADFTLVGPLGFVLTREQWLDRYRSGAVRSDDGWQLAGMQLSPIGPFRPPTTAGD
jgi:hypothetical protein